MIPQIFINYRQETAADPVGRLYANLHKRHPKLRIWMDVHSDVKGELPTVLGKKILQCDYFFVVVDQNWLTITDIETGKPRLESKGDWVRREIEFARKHKKAERIFVIYIGNTKILQKKQLPESIDFLSNYLGSRLLHDKYDNDINDLLEDIGLPPYAKTNDIQNSHILLSFLFSIVLGYTITAQFLPQIKPKQELVDEKTILSISGTTTSFLSLIQQLDRTTHDLANANDSYIITKAPKCKKELCQQLTLLEQYENEFFSLLDKLQKRRGDFEKLGKTSFQSNLLQNAYFKLLESIDKFLHYAKIFRAAKERRTITEENFAVISNSVLVDWQIHGPSFKTSREILTKRKSDFQLALLQAALPIDPPDCLTKSHGDI